MMRKIRLLREACCRDKEFTSVSWMDMQGLKITINVSFDSSYNIDSGKNDDSGGGGNSSWSGADAKLRLSFTTKYDVAISTACPGLDYIVVETSGAAQACVELLRRENLGVATFMILEKQVDHLSKLKAKVSTPEGVPRLFDLIKVQDDRMKLAFFAALGNTVVAKDLEQVGSSTLFAVNLRRKSTMEQTQIEEKLEAFEQEVMKKNWKPLNKK
ncbi:structural maintenance of chromosomes protein 4 [Cucumis melo var. makuwa]|uniref:Structural maintenance of chromosomes protein 4 n=1 Tax=Cucumis melo var. makuwa TaxID=1194695 RepID=A0A5D3CUF6_CUCMM|nr:structural maintenance of chromosomes protein 4 [Cucumis melo var. makuwa]